MWNYSKPASAHSESLPLPPSTETQVIRLPADGSAPHLLLLSTVPTEYMYFVFKKWEADPSDSAGRSELTEHRDTGIIQKWKWDPNIARRSRFVLPDVRSYWKEPVAWRQHHYFLFTIDDGCTSSPVCHGTYIIWYSFALKYVPAHQNVPPRLQTHQVGSEWHDLWYGDVFLMKVADKYGIRSNGWAVYDHISPEFLHLDIMQEYFSEANRKNRINHPIQSPISLYFPGQKRAVKPCTTTIYSYLRSFIFEPTPPTVTIQAIRFPANGHPPHLQPLRTTTSYIHFGMCKLPMPDLQLDRKPRPEYGYSQPLIVVDTQRYPTSPPSCHGLYMCFFQLASKDLQAHGNVPPNIISHEHEESYYYTAGVLYGDVFLVKVIGPSGEDWPEYNCLWYDWLMYDWAGYEDVPPDFLELNFMQEYFSNGKRRERTNHPVVNRFSEVKYE